MLTEHELDGERSAGEMGLIAGNEGFDEWLTLCWKLSCGVDELEFILSSRPFSLSWRLLISPCILENDFSSLFRASGLCLVVDLEFSFELETLWINFES